MTRQPRDLDDVVFYALQVVAMLMLVGGVIFAGVLAYQRHQAEIAVMLKEKNR